MKKPTMKKYLIFQEMELSSLKIKKFLILSGLSTQNVSLKKNFLYFFLKKNHPKNFLLFWETETF